MLQYTLSGISHIDPDIFMIYTFFMLFTGLFVFAAIPAFTLYIGKPVSRRKLASRMLLYSLFVLMIYALTFGSTFDFSIENIQKAWFSGYKTEFVVFALLTFMPFAFIPFVWVAMCHTNKVDVRLPGQYIGKKPVKAVVVGTESIAAVEYNGKKYSFEKPFVLKLRDTVKVYLSEEKETCYLA